MPLRLRELTKIRFVRRVQNNPGLVPSGVQAAQVTAGLASSKRAARPMASPVPSSSLPASSVGEAQMPQEQVIVS